MFLKTNEQRTIFNIRPDELTTYRLKKTIIPSKIEKLELPWGDGGEYNNSDSIICKKTMISRYDYIIGDIAE